MDVDGFIETQVPGWEAPHAMTFDVILSTASPDDEFNINLYLSMLNVRLHGKFIGAGLPEGKGWEIRPQSLLSNGCLIGSSHLGSRRETLEMSQLVVDKVIKPWVETIPVSEKGCREACK
jgi:alcohol dehydrogenase (NADP+)